MINRKLQFVIVSSSQVEESKKTNKLKPRRKKLKVTKTEKTRNRTEPMERFGNGFGFALVTEPEKRTVYIIL